MTHKQAIESIRRFVAQIGGRSYLSGQSQRVYGSKAIPDFVAIFVPSRRVIADRADAWAGIQAEAGKQVAFACEVKVGRDKLTPDQAEFRRLTEQAGGYVLVASGAADVARFLGYEVWGRAD